MDNARKKQLTKPVIFLIITLVIYGADTFYNKKIVQKENPVQPVIHENVSSIPSSTDKNKTINPMPVTISSPLDSIPSPFAVLGTVPNTTSNTSSNPQTSNNSLMYPHNTANYPVFNSGALGFPPPPNSNANNAVIPKRNFVILKAILYKENGVNMAILDDGTNEVIAVEGKNTELGFVSEITPYTVTIGSRTLSLNDPVTYDKKKTESSVIPTPIFKP